MHEVNGTIVGPEKYGLDTSLLSYKDKQWLTHLGMEWPSLEQEESCLIELNTVAIRGDEHIKPGMPERQVQEIMEAREVFLNLFVNVSDETVEELRGLNATLMPTGTIIATQRVLETNGISGLVVNDFPSILSYGPDGVSEKIRVLSELGVELPAVVNVFPSILSYSSQTVRDKVGVLNALGVAGKEVVSRYPQILKLSSQQVTDRAAYLASYGLNVSKAITALPSLINLLPETVRRKVGELERLSIRRASIADNPMILGYATESVEGKMELLRRMDLDPVAVIAEAPEVLSYAQHSVEQKVHNIKQLGFTPKKILGKHPMLLYYAPESLATKV
ncbi:MAG TPA: hypothetical protein VJ836_06760 [Candidatus Saccharimonadales bacterium]|nr:hypothetical protein [Candidatus Saccharimonadales bacterium]